jgi:hypothetical protein
VIAPPVVDRAYHRPPNSFSPCPVTWPGPAIADEVVPAPLAPPFLSAQPCVVVLALIPAGIVLSALALARGPRGGIRFANL